MYGNNFLFRFLHTHLYHNSNSGYMVMWLYKKGRKNTILDFNEKRYLVQNRLAISIDYHDV